MALAAMLVDSTHPALEDTEISLNRIRMSLASAILSSAMIDALVIGKLTPDFHIVASLIGH